MRRTNSCSTSSCVNPGIVINARYTLGRGGDEQNILFDLHDNKHKLFRIERGGEVRLEHESDL